VGAVLLLLFLPIVIAIGAMISLGNTFAGIVFLALSSFIVLAALHMARHWDADGDADAR
jgi:hypothetical protein